MSQTVQSVQTVRPSEPDLSRFSLVGRTAVITGASRNIGAAMSMGSAEAGADVVLVARDNQRLAAHAAAVRERTGRRVVEVVADVTAAEAPEVIEAAAQQLPGGVDILVNNAFAGGSVDTPLVEAPESAWREVLETNLTTPNGQAIDHPAHKHLLPLIPLGRLARPEELVGAAIYLASDAAS